MSKADDLHNNIMIVIMSEMQTDNCTYADVFGALAVSKAFFEVEYSAKMAANAKWREKWREALKSEESPNTELMGRAL